MRVPQFQAIAQGLVLCAACEYAACFIFYGYMQQAGTSEFSMQCAAGLAFRVCGDKSPHGLKDDRKRDAAH